SLSSDAYRRETATPRACPPALHDALPIWGLAPSVGSEPDTVFAGIEPPGVFVSHDRGESWRCMNGFHTHPTNNLWHPAKGGCARSDEHTSELQSRFDLVCRLLPETNKT